MIKSKKILKIILFLEIICLIIFPLHIPIIRNYQAKAVSRSIQNEIEELDQQIKLKQRKVEEIKRKTEYYQKIIETKRKEVLNLKNQISILDDRLEKANLAIQSTETKIDQVKLEIKRINLQIKDKTEKIKEKRRQRRRTKKILPRNLHRIYPVVKGKSKMRKGKGFSKKELIEAEIDIQDIYNLRISYDKRRKSSYKVNIQTLKKLKKGN